MLDKKDYVVIDKIVNGDNPQLLSKSSLSGGFIPLFIFVGIPLIIAWANNVPIYNWPFFVLSCWWLLVKALWMAVCFIPELLAGLKDMFSLGYPN